MVTMSKTCTKLFKSNKTQAVRLPKSVAFDDSVAEVEITVQGNSRIISPVGTSWDDWFDGPEASADFLQHREQPEEQGREGL